MNVGTALGMCRRLRGIKADDAAKVVGCTRRDLQWIESGKSKRLRFQRIMRLCRLYGVDPWTLVP